MLNYQAALINVPFDIDCRNVLRFDNREAQENYFQVASLFLNAQQINFNAGSLLETSIIYNKGQTESLTELLSKNYCIIKDNSPEATLKYYYYYVKNIMQDSASQVKVLLELDIFQTYYIDLDFTPCQIERAHLNRFVTSDSNIKFNDTINSRLFLNEPLQENGKRLVSRKSLKWIITGNEEIDTWLHDNIAYWVYVYINGTSKYTTYALDGTESKTGTGFNAWYSETLGANANAVKNDYGILCYPVYKKNTSILNGIKLEYGTKQFLVNEGSFESFREKNNDASYIYSRKISLMPPFRTIYTTRFRIENNNLIISFSNPTGGTINPIITSNDSVNELGGCRAMITDYSANDALFGGIEQSSKPLESYPIQLDYQLTFNSNEIVGSQRNLKFNPKLLNSDNLAITLKSYDGTTFEYDLQKLGTNTLSFLYSETLQAEISKYYCRVKGNNGLYVIENEKSLLGLVGSTDTTIALSNNQYAAYLANNKNFWMQSNFKIISGAARDIGQSAVAGSPKGLMGGISNALIGTGQQLIDRFLTTDNLRQSPEALQRGGGNALFSSQVDEIAIYLEVHQTLQAVQEIEDDFTTMFGYVYNKIDKIKNNDNIRKYYNFIQAEIQETTGINISRAVHDKFKSAFKNGVRFWNTDNFSYENENYERWLENEN